MVSESKEEIMEATYKALSEHGYADLSIKDISERMDKGKSAIYYYYDDKDELINAFLDYLIRQLKEEIGEIDRSKNTVYEVIDLLLDVEDEEMWNLHKALFELRIQSSYNEEIKEKFEELDRVVKKKLFEGFEELESIERPEIFAELLLSATTGTIDRNITFDDQDEVNRIREQLKQIIC